MKETPAPLLQAINVAKYFSGVSGSFELFSAVCLDIFPEETISCVGRSGEGKTTLLHILGGLDSPTSGAIILPRTPEKNIEENTTRSDFSGFIFQSFHLLEELSVLENILLPPRIARKSLHKKGFFFQKAIYLLEKVGLETKIHIKAKWLSGGEKQRVAIARALIMDPQIIFADEPTGNLDSKTAESIIQLLFETVRREKKALFLVTHQEDIASVCSKKTLLQNKRLIHL